MGAELRDAPAREATSRRRGAQRVGACTPRMGPPPVLLGVTVTGKKRVTSRKRAALWGSDHKSAESNAKR